MIKMLYLEFILSKKGMQRMYSKPMWFPCSQGVAFIAGLATKFFTSGNLLEQESTVLQIWEQTYPNHYI